MEHHLVILEDDRPTLECLDTTCHDDYGECIFRRVDPDSVYERVFEDAPDEYAIGDYVLKPGTYILALDWDERDYAVSLHGVKDDFLTTRMWVGGIGGYMLRFLWHGGEYIDISFDRHPDKGPFEVINVWTAENKARIPFRLDDFEKVVREYANDPESDHDSNLKNFAFEKGIS
jgi:hypothetical protein